MYHNSIRQATACVCSGVEVRECAGTHCLTELSGGVVQRNLKPARLTEPKENAQKIPAIRRGFFYTGKEDDMDLLLQCAQNFKRLIPYQYHMVVGRKGKTLDFTVSFDMADFHHLAGLHKLRDNVRFQTGKRSDIMREILEGRLTLSTAKQSAFFHEMESRLSPLAALEHFLDSNEIIFRYNFKANIFSAIQADYLLQNDFNGTPVYLFLAQRSGENTLGCRTFFPKSEKDYTQGQPRYTLLKKEKICLPTGETVIQYDRLTPKIKKEEN